MRINDQIELSLVPEIHGRSAAGVNHTNTGHASPTTAVATPPHSSCLTAVTRPRGATQKYASASAGSTSRPVPIFVSKPAPTITPAQTNHLVLPSSAARTVNHSAAVEHSTTSASGLLWREIATAIGVSASTRPAAKPPARPKTRRTMS